MPLYERKVHTHLTENDVLEEDKECYPMIDLMTYVHYRNVSQHTNKTCPTVTSGYGARSFRRSFGQKYPTSTATRFRSIDISKKKTLKLRKKVVREKKLDPTLSQ